MTTINSPTNIPAVSFCNTVAILSLCMTGTIRTEAERIKAYRDVDGVRWYFVMFAGPFKIHEFDSERLEYFVTTLHKELRSRAN
jgi:hypothetical protein